MPQRKRGAAIEVYGFVGWIASFVAYVVFIAWAFLPDSVLQPLGITYYPDRYWAIAIPVWIMVLGAFAVIFYFGINLTNTEPLNSIFTVVDEHSRSVGHERNPPPGSIPATVDIPITVVNELMFMRRPNLTMRRVKSTPMLMSDGDDLD
eukprot:TRINITY_DN9195_c0_g1_i1.p1 TRINITY_DN9195_c0_g1~~TRINITY_DN9195_c0_g1_i1.p1  ORF type:complete len:175 (+),score=6.01 TRINITY_DN9195_c0_g1_i1:81-527(+)